MFQPNIPQPTDNLDDSQGDILANFQAINTSFAVDHVPLTDTSGDTGKHDRVHLVDSSALVPYPPSTGATEIALYSKQWPAASGLYELFMRRKSNGVEVQITGASSSSSNGYATLPGGITLKWGNFTANATTMAFTYGGFGLPNYSTSTFYLNVANVNSSGLIGAVSTLFWSNSGFTATGLHNTYQYTFLSIGL